MINDPIDRVLIPWEASLSPPLPSDPAAPVTRAHTAVSHPGRPIIPFGAVYIGRANRWYRLPKSKWANPFAVRLEADRETAIASYERWLRSQPQLMAALPELHGHDLVCWCAPLPCHGDVVLRLASECA